jgi:hypothetical protein
MPAKPNARGAAGAARRAGNGRAARTDAGDAMEDSQAEVNDVSAVLSSPAAAAGESGGPPKSAGPADRLLERRLATERTEKEKAIKEKEIMQKKMDEMQAQLELAHSKVGDVVTLSCQLKVPLLLPPARYACN